MLSNVEEQDPSSRGHAPEYRRWRRFKRNRRGYFSLLLFGLLFVISLGAELLSNDVPILIIYNGNFYFPLVRAYPEKVFGGDFETEADYKDPYILERITSGTNRAFFRSTAIVSIPSIWP